MHTSGNEEARLIDLLRGHSLDGLIVHPAPDDPILPLLGELLVPTVAIADITKEVPSVAVDDAGGGALLAQHLASLGHRHVLVKRSSVPRPSATVRIPSFVDACTRLGVRVAEGVEIVDRNGGLDADDLRTLTEGERRATAVMGWSDAMAESICRSLESVGVRVPQTIAVVGFDGFCRSFAPRFDLTTIKAPWATVGREAVRLLDTLILAGSVPMLTTLPVVFHHGNTT